MGMLRHDNPNVLVKFLHNYFHNLINQMHHKPNLSPASDGRQNPSFSIPKNIYTVVSYLERVTTNA